jgi:hypothetical protein
VRSGKEIKLRQVRSGKEIKLKTGEKWEGEKT